MISSELAPYAKTGGLGDVTAALASRLQRHGHDLRVFLPLYSDIDRGQISLTAVETLQDIELTTSGSGLRYSVFTGSQADGLVIHFIDCPMLYERPGIYTEDDDEHLRFNTLSRCAIEYCQHLAWAPEIVHCNDWQSSLVPLYLKTLYAWDRLFANTRSVLSIHNIGYQGVFNAEIIDTTGLGGHREMFDQHDLAKGRLNFLKTGVLYADALTTVSPTYAQEICTAEYGMGLEDLLKHR
ncbi:MAG: glycogen/starch synthase, partial [Gammaproteobacteria bacterium]|nr:glycogen/starch synthase [Gammaproteobacteria bacterium]